MTKKHKTTIRNIISIIGVTAIFVITCYSIVFADTYSTQYDADSFDLTLNAGTYAAAIDDCTVGLEGAIELINPNEPTGNLRAQSGDHYGSGICPIEIIFNDPSQKLSVLISQATTGDLNNGSGAPFHRIDNALGDCTIDTGGNTDEEEFGYRLENVSVVSNVNVDTNSDCGVAYNATATSPNEYIFDLEYGNDDQVIYSDGSFPYPTCFPTDCTFDLKVAANVAWNTVADTTYSQAQLGSYYVSIDVVPVSP